MYPQKLELNYPLAHLSLDGDILRITLQAGQDISLETVKEMYRDANEALGGKPVAVLLDTRQTNLMRFPESVMRYAANNEYSHREIAYGILISGIAYQLIAKFYMQMHGPKTPTRIFGDEKDALVWLQQKADEHKQDKAR